MINIRRIEPHEATAAKEVIYRVGHRVFQEKTTLEESMARYESGGRLHDIDEVQRVYFQNRGTFLVITDNEKIIGTGAIRRIDEETCEIKRLWLLFEYQGRGLGYRMLQELLAFAKEAGYRRIRLETDRTYQSRAYNLYKRVGFYDIPRYGDHEDDSALEMKL